MEAIASPDPVLDAVREALDAIPSRSRLLVAVSGGRDSVALLHAVHKLGRRGLTVVHLDHGLRGRSSLADANFVRKLAARLELPCLSGRSDVRSYAKERGISLEFAAREMRHIFFASAAKRTGARDILLAHHADDQIETCLFHFLRGSGAAGLAGMRPCAQMALGRMRLRLHRPLLGVRRSEIDACIAGQQLAFREDATNALPDATRNRLRLTVLPAIYEATGESSAEAILRAADIFAAEEAWMREIAAPYISAMELDVRLLRGLHLAFTRRILKGWLATRGVAEVSFQLVERVRALLPENAVVAKVNLPGGRHCRRRAGRLFVQ